MGEYEGLAARAGDDPQPWLSMLTCRPHFRGIFIAAGFSRSTETPSMPINWSKSSPAELINPLVDSNPGAPADASPARAVQPD